MGGVFRALGSWLVYIRYMNAMVVFGLNLSLVFVFVCTAFDLLFVPNCWKYVLFACCSVTVLAQ